MLEQSSPKNTAIAAPLKDMDMELPVLEKWQAKPQALNQGMMEELLTGGTRLV